MTTRRQALIAAAGGCAAFARASAFGQSFPSRPVHWIVPYAPGGGSDVSKVIRTAGIRLD